MNHHPAIDDVFASGPDSPSRIRRESLAAFFVDDEIARLEQARRTVCLDRATIAYCVYENPFARSGGVYAVAANYCAELVRQRRDVLALSPFHSDLKTAPDTARLNRLGSCGVPFAGQEHPLEMFEHVEKGVRWVLLRSDGFFTAHGGSGGADPYVHADTIHLLSDSLFASAAVPRVLAQLGRRDNLVLHAQDWQFAATALTVKLALLAGLLRSAAVVLTSHNPYDHALPVHALRWLTERGRENTGGGPGVRVSGERAYTVYQRMIPLLDAPVTTVSRTFAEELSSDPLQTEVFADHLQGALRRRGLVGVDNGLFAPPRRPFRPAEIRALTNDDPSRILAAKLRRRRKMLEVLEEYEHPHIMGTLEGGRKGQALSALPDDVPVFMMFGRLDPGQKGFDALARAIEALPRRRSRFILTPIVAGGHPAFLEDLRRLADLRRGEVAVYPFRMERGYLETMAGASFVVMPSLYEPFGGATEPFLAGTPVVARGTGGLLQQVADIDEDPRWGTGLVYHETSADVPGQWRQMQSAADPAARMAVPVYGAMVASLAAALTRAGDIYRSEPRRYARMLANLFPQARSFSWQRSAEEYYNVYGIATGGTK